MDTKKVLEKNLEKEEQEEAVEQMAVDIEAATDCGDDDKKQTEEKKSCGCGCGCR